MKKSRNEKMVEHLLNVDEEILSNAYEVDDAEKLRQYVKTKNTKKTGFMSSVSHKVAAVAACFVLIIGAMISIPFLSNNVVPIVNETGNTTQTNEGEICKNTEDASSSNDSQSNIDSSVLSSDETKKVDIPIIPYESQSITEDSHNNYPDFTTISLSQWLSSEDVRWLDGSLSKGNKSSDKLNELGKVILDEKLVNLFDGNKDTVYAVMVDFSSMINDEFIFEGKKISELLAEKNAFIANEKMVEAKLVSQKINQAKEAFYFSMLDTFEEEFTSMGLGIYHENQGCTIDNCIFYTFATQTQLENFECTSSQAFIFSAAVRFK